MSSSVIGLSMWKESSIIVGIPNFATIANKFYRTGGSLETVTGRASYHMCSVSSLITLSLWLVELKNGETYNGHLDGDRFWRMSKCYIRGNTIKYLRIADELILKEEI
uniref:LSM domain-containing protein n=1 Tax=Glossina pallidipes TaxID=7398 RepID=A0A1B0A5P7_GLOPL